VGKCFYRKPYDNPKGFESLGQDIAAKAQLLTIALSLNCFNFIIFFSLRVASFWVIPQYDLTFVEFS
jgi:hypothetical protein